MMKPAKTIDTNVDYSNTNKSFTHLRSTFRRINIIEKSAANVFKLRKKPEIHNENDHEPKDASQIPLPVQHNKPIMTRINPKQAQN